jgi:hypothetical protein
MGEDIRSIWEHDESSDIEEAVYIPRYPGSFNRCI